MISQESTRLGNWEPGFNSQFCHLLPEVQPLSFCVFIHKLGVIFSSQDDLEHCEDQMRWYCVPNSATLYHTVCQYRLSAGKGPENCHNLKEMGFRRGLFIEVIADESLKESNWEKSMGWLSRGDLVFPVSKYSRRWGQAPDCRKPDSVGVAQLMAWLRNWRGSSRWNWEWGKKVHPTSFFLEMVFVLDSPYKLKRWFSLGS